MNRSKIENDMNERELLDAETERVVGMLASLPRVEAPANFEFGMRAKMATASPQSAGTSWFPLVKVAAPLALLMVIGASVLFYTTLPNAEVPSPIAEVTQPSMPSPVQPNVSQPSPTSVSVPPIEPPASVVPQRASTEVPSLGPVRRTNRSESVNTAANQSITMSGGSANVFSPPGTDERTARPVSVTEVMQIIGLKANFASGGWRVASTVLNSSAESWGIKAGDLIEAMNGETLKADTSFKPPFSPSSLRVRRDGKLIDIKLK